MLTGQMTAVAAAPPPSVAGARPLTLVKDPCAQQGTCPAAPPANQAVTLSLPAGTRTCPDSGPAAACRVIATPDATTPGAASLPAGTTTCPMTPDKPVPADVGTCSDTQFDAAGGSPSASPKAASGHASSAGGRQAYGLSLAASSAIVGAGSTTSLIATSTATISGTNLAIEIFDQTAGVLVTACGEMSQCEVNYAAKAGTHTFVAFLTPPTTDMPAHPGAMMSNSVTVGWLDAGIAASDVVAAPGGRVTITATSTLDVQSSGRWLEIYDLTSASVITYCTRGTVCATSIAAPAGSVHELVAHVTGSPESVSSPLTVSWLGVTLAATTLTQSTIGAVYLQAAVNADLTNTPWVLGIYDAQGRLVGQTCDTGSSCTATTSADGAGSTAYTAAVTAASADLTAPVGRTRDRSNSAGTDLAGAVARSAPVKPGRLLWGVDSCKAFTSDSSGANGLYAQVSAVLGAPDFWGRYLTDTVCPAISQSEIAVASQSRMGILPIYNDYDCSAVTSYATGAAYAVAAVAAANGLGIPVGRGLAIDIEPPGPACPGAGNVDAGFVTGWYDGIRAGGYVPIYYGNGTAGSEFGSAWCAAVASSPDIAAGSYLWSFEPDLQGAFSKANAPGFGPYSPGCPATTAAWQYEISVGATPDVDHDLALSTLPLWYP